MVDEFVRQPEMEDRQRETLRDETFRDCAARAARDDILFERHERLVRAREMGDELRIDGFDEAHVGDRRVDFLGRGQGRIKHAAESEQRDAVRPPPRLATDLALAYSELRQSALDRNARADAARITHRGGRIEPERRGEHLPTFVFVGGRHYRHVRQAAQIR
jgi:hypothetical protein